jgi:hypothetical protein
VTYSAAIELPPVLQELIEYPTLLLTDDQTDALAEGIGRAFPPWKVWRSHGIWYATGPCPDPSCVCTRTLHAPSPSGLCRQLEGVS